MHHAAIWRFSECARWTYSLQTITDHPPTSFACVLISRTSGTKVTSNVPKRFRQTTPNGLSGDSKPRPPYFLHFSHQQSTSTININKSFHRHRDCCHELRFKQKTLNLDSNLFTTLENPEGWYTTSASCHYSEKDLNSMYHINLEVHYVGF